MKINLIFPVLLLTSSTVFAEKSPDWWCRVVSENESFLGFGVTSNEACSNATAQCKAKHENCEIDDYGEW